VVKSIPQAPFPSLFAMFDRTTLDYSRRQWMATAHHRRKYNEISYDLLTLHCDFNSMAHKGT
jgi:hypothetical protein